MVVTAGRGGEVSCLSQPPACPLVSLPHRYVTGGHVFVRFRCALQPPAFEISWRYEAEVLEAVGVSVCMPRCWDGA